MKTFEVAKKTQDLDEVLNVPKIPYGYSGKLSGRGVSSKLDPSKENDDSDNLEALNGTSIYLYLIFAEALITTRRKCFIYLIS